MTRLFSEMTDFQREENGKSEHFGNISDSKFNVCCTDLVCQPSSDLCMYIVSEDCEGVLLSGDNY